MKHFRRRMLANGLAMALVVSSLAVIPAAAANNVDFKDIKGHWAESQIKNFLEKGHINGYGDNTFRPDNKITRAEFIKIVNMAFGFTEKGKENFKDVKPGDWFYDEVLKAVKQGYIEGYGDNTFRPDAAISREEACKIIGVIVKANGVGDTKFKDDKEIESWAKKYVKGLVDMGIIRGFGDDTFRPKSNTSRAESVTAIKDSVEYTPSTGGGGGSSQDRVAPKLVTSELKGNKIELVFDESLAGAVNKEEFAVKDGNREIKINAILNEKNKITMKLEKAFGSGALGANIKVSYKGTSLSDAAGNKVAEFEKEASNVSMHLNIDGSSRVGKGTESIYNAKHDDNTDATNVSWYVEGSNKDNSIEGVSITADGKLVVEESSPVESIEVVAVSESNGKTYVAKKFVTLFQRTELEIATDTVTKAETTRDYNDYMEAQRLINKLPNSLEKTALQERLANVVTVKVEKLGEKEYMTLQFPKQISKFTIMSGDKSLVFGLNEEEFKLEIKGATTSNPDSNGFRKYTIGETEITAKVEYSRVIFEVVDGNTDITNIEFEVK